MIFFQKLLFYSNDKSFSFQIRILDIFLQLEFSNKVFKRQCYETFIAKYNFWISIQDSFQKSLQRCRYSFQANKFFRFDTYIYKEHKYYISTYGGKAHMHEYSKMHVDRLIDIEIILHHVKGMIVLSVVW